MTEISIGTNIVGSTFFEQGNVIADTFKTHGVFEQIHVLNTDVTRQEGAGRLITGDIEFGLCASNWVPRLAEGAPPFSRSYDVRMVAPLNVGAPFFVVREDSEINTFNEIFGKRVAVGPRDGGMTQHMKLILQALGYSFDDIDPVYVEFDKGTEGLLTGDVDVMWQVPVPNHIMTGIEKRLSVRVVEYGPGQLSSILQAVPLYRHAIIEKDLIKGLKSDTEQIGVLNVIITNADVATETVFQFVSAYIKAAKELGIKLEVFRKLKSLIEEIEGRGPQVFEPGGVQFHPGAWAAYKQAGLLT
ncbi:MAG: TAXI family TRAP transporter solute-binding subunit [Alphaproteobacteria bacterium]